MLVSILTRNEGVACTVDGCYKIWELKALLLTSSRRKAVNEKVNELEKSTIAPLDSLLEWLGTAVSLFRFVVSSRLQKCLYDVHISESVSNSLLFKNSGDLPPS